MHKDQLLRQSESLQMLMSTLLALAGVQLKYKKSMHAICGSAFFDINGEAVQGFGSPRVCEQRKCQNAIHGNGMPYVKKQRS